MEKYFRKLVKNYFTCISMPAISTLKLIQETSPKKTKKSLPKDPFGPNPRKAKHQTPSLELTKGGKFWEDSRASTLSRWAR